MSAVEITFTIPYSDRIVVLTAIMVLNSLFRIGWVGTLFLYFFATSILGPVLLLSWCQPSILSWKQKIGIGIILGFIMPTFIVSILLAYMTSMCAWILYGV